MMSNPDYLEGLELLRGGINKDELKRKFDHEWDYTDFVARVQENKHAHNSKTPDGEEVLKLSTQGLSYLRREREFIKKWYRKAEWWGIIITGIIGISALLVAIFI